MSSVEGAQDQSPSSGTPQEKDFGNVTEARAVTNTNVGLLSEVEHFSDGSLEPDDIEAIAAHLDDHSVEESIEIIREAIEYHAGDPCLSNTYYKHMMTVVEGTSPSQSEEEWEALVKFDAFLIKDWSIYPEIRAVTPAVEPDDDENYVTLRSFLVGVLWSCAGSVLATFFAVRQPAIQINSVALQVIVAGTGKALTYIPAWSIPLGFGYRINWGSGPWTYKEQLLATCGMSVGNTTPYSQNIVISMANKYFYGFADANSFGFTILLTLSTNIMGFGIAGIFRVFLVYPVRMLWYGILPQMKVSKMLVVPEKRETVNGWRLTTFEFFWLFSFLEFGWFWITDFVFEFLAYMDWMAWIDPNNNDLLSVCGIMNNGLGINPFPSLDPSLFQVTNMVTPLYATIMLVIGAYIAAVAIIIVWYTNVVQTGYFPINSNALYTNTGDQFVVGEVLYMDDAKTVAQRGMLDPEKYQNYSLPYWSAGNIITYGSFFMLYPATIMFSLLNYLDIMWYSTKIFMKTMIHPGRALRSFDDRFSRNQRKYKEVPEWWYLFTLAVCLGLGIATVEHYSFTSTPVWTIFFAMGLTLIFMVPTGALYSTTNTQITLNVLFELIVGLTNKGNGMALMVAKAYGTNFSIQGDDLLTNMKTAHYANIAQRPLFAIQMVSILCNSFAQAGLIVWQAGDSIKDMCSLKLQTTNKFTCQNIRVYFNAAVLWGTIGPERVFKGLYPSMKWTFLIGAAYPIPFWIVRKFIVHHARKNHWGDVKSGGSAFRNHWFIRELLSIEWVNAINELVLLFGGLQFGGYSLMYITPTLYVGLFFQGFLPRYYPRWWRKYNYLLYGALTVGFGYGNLILFFATSYNHLASVDWWGNDTGISLQSGPRLNVTQTEPRGYFGPEKGHLPK